jgi:hypothetical protein
MNYLSLATLSPSSGSLIPVRYGFAVDIPVKKSEINFRKKSCYPDYISLFNRWDFDQKEKSVCCVNSCFASGYMFGVD